MFALDNLYALLAEPAAQALGYALLHSLWQGALVALLLWGLLKLMRGRPTARYALSCAALALMLIVPGLTWYALTDSIAAEATAAVATEAADAATPLVPVIGVDKAASEASAVWRPMVAAQLYLPYLVAGWAAGVLVLLARLFGGWSYARYQIAREAKPAPEAWQARFEALTARLGIAQRARLLLAARPGSPYVFGWLRPVIVLPASVLAALPPWQVEAILAHELAHVRRYDFLVGLLQSAAETLLFYHPAAWWISRHICIEREHCCDDRAVAACGDAAAYARSLLALEEYRQASRGLALAATDGSLLGRIRRLVAPKTAASSRIGAPSSRIAPALASLVAAGVLFTACADLVHHEKPAATAPLTDEANRPLLTVDLRYVMMDDEVIIGLETGTAEPEKPLQSKPDYYLHPKPFIHIRHPDWAFIVSAAPFEQSRQAGMFRGGTLTFEIAGKTIRLESRTDLVGPNPTPAYVRVAYTPDTPDAVRSTHPYISIRNHARVLKQSEFPALDLERFLKDLKRPMYIIQGVEVYDDFDSIEPAFKVVGLTTGPKRQRTVEEKVELAIAASGFTENLAIVVGKGDQPPSMETLPEEYRNGTDFKHAVQNMQPGNFVVVKLMR